MDFVALFIRPLLYVAAVLTVGSVALRVTLPVVPGSRFDGVLSRQLWIGTAALILAALGLMTQFLLLIAGGDLAMALSPDFLAIGAQTPVGQANVLRLVAAIALGVSLMLGSRKAAIVPAGALLLSFALEGHSLSYGARLLNSGLLIVHLAIVVWWLAVLMPLLGADKDDRDRLGHAFGRQAIIAVPVLLLAGVLLLAQFTGWQIDLSGDYQRRMVIKLVAVAGILAIAAANKLYFTGKPAFVWALRTETGIALTVLALTAFLTATGPDM